MTFVLQATASNCASFANKAALRSARSSASYVRGLRYEEQACHVYQQAGYRVLRKRFKTNAGEIDLVALKDNTLCFAEVKQRKTLTLAAESITARQIKRIYHAASYWLQQHPEHSQLDCRFDAILFDSQGRCELLFNAWS